MIDPAHNDVADTALRERLVDSLEHWTDPNGRRGGHQKLAHFTTELCALHQFTAFNIVQKLERFNNMESSLI